jgi:hypothetical protein
MFRIVELENVANVMWYNMQELVLTANTTETRSTWEPITDIKMMLGNGVK